MAKRKSKKPEREPYVLPERSGLKKGTTRVLSLDPGSANMGISVVAANDSHLRIMANSIVYEPIFDLTILNSQRSPFIAEIERWVELYRPQAFVAERFQTRGIKGKTVECVNIMIGLIAGRWPEIPIRFIPASQWKNAHHRRFKSDEDRLDNMYKRCRTTPHQLDSAFIGVYGIQEGLGRTFEYDPQALMHQCETTSLVKLHNRRNKE